MTTGEAIKCRCGMRMIHTPRGAFICENCDQLQPQQIMGLARSKTREDVRFNMYWQEVMHTEYADNTKKDDPRCPTCQVEEHDTCSMTPGCPCCDDTIAQMTEGDENNE